MTTLEIKRLDSQPTASATASAYSKYSNRSSATAVITSNGGGVNGDYMHEIPISIIKSPSYNQISTTTTTSNTSPPSKSAGANYKHATLVLPSGPGGGQSAGGSTASPSTVTITNSSVISKSQSSGSSINNNSNGAIVTNAAVAVNGGSNNNSSGAAVPVANGNVNANANVLSSLNRRSTSASNNDDFDSVLVAQNNASLMPNADGGNTLTFNKYGVLQPVATANGTDTLSSKTTNTLSRDATASIGRSKSKNSPKKEAGSAAASPSVTRKNDESQLSDGDGGQSAAAAVTNLKDYIQNTDVEEFSEHLPVDVIRSRETKWIEMLKSFDEWMDKRFKKVKSRCRKGIPQSMRSRAWMHLSGAVTEKTKKPSYYADCLQNLKNVDVSKYIEDIKKDLHRQFPGHEIFMKREGRQMLYNVLRAYAVHNREVGYCQAQGPIAAVLLMHMPEEDAFWMLIQISDVYLKEYFKPGLEKVQIDGQALFYLFKQINPTAHKLLKSQGIDPILYMTEWFMCIYARTLPWCTILRVWDMFFCEGVKVLYRVGLFLMRSAFGDKEKLQRCKQQGMYETMNLLKNLPVENLHEAYMVRESSLIKISEQDLIKAFDKSKIEFTRQMNEMNKNRKQPPPQSSYMGAATATSSSSKSGDKKQQKPKKPK